MGGWDVSVHHTFDRANETLYLGDGTRRNIQDTGNVINTVAGTGNLGRGCDVRGPRPLVRDSTTPTELRLAPTAACISPIKAIIASAAWTRTETSREWPALASRATAVTRTPPPTRARLLGPVRMAVGADGSLYIGRESCDRVRT